MNHILKFQPDLVLMDSRMPMKNGVEAVTEIRKKHPAAWVFVKRSVDLFECLCILKIALSPPRKRVEKNS